MRLLVKELSKSSTVILSTHILQEIEAMCDRVIIIQSGNVIVDSKLDELERIEGLKLIVDADEKSLQKVLNEFVQSNEIQLKNVIDNQYEYILKADPVLIPQISKKLIEENYKLFEIAPIKNNLETLFKEDYVSDNKQKSVAKNVA